MRSLADVAGNISSGSKYILGNAPKASSAARSAAGLDACSGSMTRASGQHDLTIPAVPSVHPLQGPTTSSSPGAKPVSSASRQR